MIGIMATRTTTVVDPSVPAGTRRAVDEQFCRDLAARYPGTRWRVDHGWRPPQPVADVEESAEGDPAGGG
jgi:hypothetical protein